MAASKTAPAVPPSVGPEPIEPGTLYPLKEFHRRTGWGRHAVRAARRNGLKVHYAGNRAYVLGCDFIAYVTADRGGRDHG